MSGLSENGRPTADSERFREDLTLREIESIYGSYWIARDDPAEVFHENTKFMPSVGYWLDVGQRFLASDHLLQSSVRTVRRRPSAVMHSLPSPLLPTIELGDALAKRKCIRKFSRGAGLSQNELSCLLYAMYGQSRSGNEDADRRLVPSAGALYPLEIYLATNAVDGLRSGLYHYDSSHHSLEMLASGRTFQAQVHRSYRADDETPAAAAVFIFITSVFLRSRVKYALRGYRFALLEAGHAMQNLLLTAVACGVAAVPYSGFYDCVVEEMLEIDGVNESLVYAACVGRPADARDGRAT